MRMFSWLYVVWITIVRTNPVEGIDAQYAYERRYKGVR